MVYFPIGGHLKRSLSLLPFLADRTSVASVVVCLSVTLCIVAKRSVLEQVTWQPIGSRIDLWEIDWYQNEWPWPLFRGRIKVICQPLRYIRRWISGKPLQIEAWFQRTTNIGIWG